MMGIDDEIGLELLTPAEMTRADAMTIASGVPGWSLMERAGTAVADACLRELNGRKPVAVFCGPGNNGGDGFVAAQRLRESGCEVQVALLGSREALKGDAARAAAAWTGDVVPVSSLDLARVDLIVDGLFGAGLSRELDGEAKFSVEQMNGAGRPIVAIDIPSGIDGATGQERGGSPAAALTVTFFRAKPGHYLYPGAARRGRLLVCDIGIAADVLGSIEPRTRLNGPRGWIDRFPWPQADGHKYKRGHAVVVSGRASHTGAARLAARAALRVGAGLVTLASPPDAMAVNGAHLTAVMLREADGAAGLADILADGRKNAVVLGPGLGVGAVTRALVEVALATPPAHGDADAPRACVFDADALTSFAGDADALGALIAASPGSTVITPHDGEFARLFETRPDIAGAASKLDRVRAAADLLGCIVLLKGPDTVVAEPDGRASIGAGGSPWLATAGSGDVLSGLIGGLLAQGMPAFEAASAAVWLHAEAGRRFGPGLIAEDLPDTLPGALRELYGMRG